MNSNFEKALSLRREAKYPEALSFLNKACEENCVQAWIYKAAAYEFGGFGLFPDKQQRNICLEMAEDLDENIDTDKLLSVKTQSDAWIVAQISKRCPFAIETCCNSRQEVQWFDEKTLFQYADDGFVLAQENCYRSVVYRMDQTLIKIVEKASAQGHRPSRRYLTDLCYEDGLLQRGAKLACSIKEDEFGFFHNLLEKRRAQREVHWYDDAERLRELYAFGKNTKVFKTSNKAAKAAVLTWCWIARGWNKDMRIVIGQLVWETRSDPIIWRCETLLPQRSERIDPFYQCVTQQPKNRLHLIVGKRRYGRSSFLLRLVRHFDKIGRNMHKISHMMKQITGDYDVCLIDNIELIGEELDLSNYKCVVATIENTAFSAENQMFFPWEILYM
jgi:hypothetical protein